MGIEWWHWVVIGVALILSELVVPAMVLVWLGLGAILVAGMVALWPQSTLAAQLAVWTLASLAMVALWFRIFKPNLHRTRVGTSDAHVLGEIGMLVAAVEPYARGRVRFQKPLLGSDIWDCISDERIEQGTRVRVIDVEGSLLKVGKA